ncbi:MAG: trypsin-like peptidase domain-containing protein [Candidatus Eremiobacteraeota bacterium]|nr:trypsin-like peptidase domain-containing protein [Candidatus Eremiobacteraeota bacterium]
MHIPVDEEFPRKEHLVFAGTVSLVTALAGFLLSYNLFLGPVKDGEIKRVDRRTAEGYRERVRQARQSQSNSRSAPPTYTYLAYHRKPKEERRLASKSMPVAPVPEATTAPEVKPSKPAPSPSPSASPRRSSDDRRRPKQTAHATTRPKPTVDAGPALVFPDIKKRPSLSSLDNQWSLANASLVRMADLEGNYISGVVVDESGLAVTRSSRLGPSHLSRTWVNGSLGSATLVSRDPTLDLALIQLPPGSYKAVPLAPEGPGRGERLAYHDANDSNSYHPLEAQAMGAAGPGFFHFRGVTRDGDAGSPLLNERGELEGIVLGRMGGFPGHCFNLAVNSAGVYRMLRRANPDSGSNEDPVSARTAAMLSETVPMLMDRTRPSRSNAKVIPGKSLGNFTLGMTEKQLESELGPPEARTLASGLRRLDYPANFLTFSLVGDRVVAIETTYSFYSTEKGLCVGTALDPIRLRREFDNYIKERYLKGEVVLTPGLELELDDDVKVSKIVVVPVG